MAKAIKSDSSQNEYLDEQKDRADNYIRNQEEREKKLNANLELMRSNGKKGDTGFNAREDLRRRLYYALHSMLDEEMLYLVDDEETYETRDRALSIATLIEKLKAIGWV